MRWILLLSLWITSASLGMAQESGGVTAYNGHVSDSKGNAVEYATVILMQAQTQAGGAVTDEEGNFRIEAKAGNCQLIVQCIGYDSLQKELALPFAECDSLVISVSSYALREVVVQAKQIERKADRFVMSVLPSTGKDGTELLSQAPGVWISDGNVSINGASGTKVFVDNREIRLKGEELLAYLRSLKSGDIRRIEVIPIAGSEYDASTQGGVILITLRHRPDNGTQGYVSLETSLAPSLQKYIPATAVNARIGKWNVNAAVSAAFTPDDKVEMNTERRYTSNDYSFSSRSWVDEASRYGNGRLGAVFEMDSANSFGAEIGYIRQTADGSSRSQTDLVKQIPIGSEGAYEQRDDYNMFSATVNYLRKMDAQGSVFKIITDYVNKKSTGNNTHHITYRQMDGMSDTTYRSQAHANYSMTTTDLSLRKHLRNKTSFSLGAKYTYTLMDDKSFYEGLDQTNQWQPNEKYSFAQKYNEHIVGAYASFSAEVKRWSFVAGLRAEYARTSDRNEDFSRNYTDLFPNLNVTYSFDPAKQWLLIAQYARNIERPPFYALNPNRIQSSDYSYQIGNPFLRPTYIHRFSTTLVYNYRYTLTIGGNLHRDLIREFCKQDADNPDVSYIIYENHDVENHWFIALNLPFQPFSWLNLTGNFLGVRQMIRMTESSPFSAHSLAFVNLIATFSLPAGYTVEAKYNSVSRLYSGNSEVAPRQTLGLVARKKVMNDKLLLSVSVDNVFNQNNAYVNNLDAYRSLVQVDQSSVGRVFKLALTWNFNSGKKIKKSRVEEISGSERSRLNEK